MLFSKKITKTKCRGMGIFFLFLDPEATNALSSTLAPRFCESQGLRAYKNRIYYLNFA